jgi:hypothetical protein
MHPPRRQIHVVREYTLLRVTRRRSAGSSLETDVSGEITKLLEAWKSGDAAAGEEVIAMTYGELRRVAHAYLRRERHAHTLQTTALLHDACARLPRKGPGSV